MSGNSQKSRTALCVNVPHDWREVLEQMFQVLDVDSAAEALRALRGLAVDLLVVSADLPDETFWSLVGRIRRARPGLAWILVGDVSDADEVRARCLGVLTVFGPVAPSEGAVGRHLRSCGHIGLPEPASEGLPVDAG